MPLATRFTVVAEQIGQIEGMFLDRRLGLGALAALLLSAHMPVGTRNADSSAPPETDGVGTAGLKLHRRYIDENYGGNGKPGWVRGGDIDLDGDRDLMAGGGGALFVYENDGMAGGWTRYGDLDSTGNMGANGAELYDVDGDDDLDVVCAIYTDDLGWWENPGGDLSNTPWTFHLLSSESRYLHDILRVDIDGDGNAEEFIANLNAGYWNADITIKWFRPGADPTALWEQHTIEPDRAEGPAHGHAGLDLADIDGDGDLDLAYSNGWYEAPPSPEGAWIWHELTTLYGISNALWRDMNQDSDLDLLVANGHHGSGVYWLEHPDGTTAGTWTQHTVDADLHHPECLLTLDDASDGDLDVVTCDLFFGEEPGEPGWDEEVHNLYLIEQTGNGAGWQMSNIAPNSFPSHLLRQDDVDEDGILDLISESAGHSVISFYENVTTGLHFDLEVIDDAYPGNGRPGWSAAGDLDGDELADVIAGGGQTLHWYKAPTWTRFAIEADTSPGGNGGLVMDVDGDTDLDIVAARFNGDLAWWENPGPAQATQPWTRRAVDSAVSTFNHDLVAGDIDGDDEPEIVALYVGGGIYWYDIPADPTAGTWPRTRILATIADPRVGLALADLNDDDDLDVIASDSWFEAPMDPTTPDWTGRTIFSEPVQNLAIYDVNGDLRPDVVGAQGFENPDGSVFWAANPPDPETQNWTQHTVASGLDGPENLWVGDLNGDGFADVLTGEMGTSTGWDDSDSEINLFFGHDEQGLTWERRDAAWSVGVSARLNPFDIDGDGDLDFTADGNAEDHIYLWRQENNGEIFADGFESGDTSAWSNTVP